MKRGRQGKTEGDFARRVLEEVSRRERQREKAQYCRDLVEALSHLTGLTENELEAIAMEVRGFRVQDRDTFFSVKQQVVVLSAMLGVLQCLLWMI